MLPFKSLWFFIIIVFLSHLFQIYRTAEGYTREVCKYRKGKLVQPVSEYRQRLQAVREQMQIRASLQGPEIDAYILPSCDEHLNREVSEADQRLQYLTGFTGTDAFAVITQKGAAMWVENRYVLQANGELDCDWELYIMNDTISIANWLDSQLYAEQRVGADPHLVPHQLWLNWSNELSQKLLILTKINNNLIDLIWGPDRPQPPKITLQVWEKIYAGERWEDKIRELRDQLHYHYQCDAMIVTSLTEIAYLLNIRGRDIPFTPVVKRNKVKM